MTRPQCHVCQRSVYELAQLLILCISAFQFNCLIKKIQQDRATGVVIVPLWPTQPWFTVLLYLLTGNPRILPCSKTLLTQSHNGALHPLRNQLGLIACKLSGERSNREAVQAKLLISSSNLGLLEPRNNLYLSSIA